MSVVLFCFWYGYLASPLLHECLIISGCYPNLSIFSVLGPFGGSRSHATQSWSQIVGRLGDRWSVGETGSGGFYLVSLF